MNNTNTKIDLICSYNEHQKQLFDTFFYPTFLTHLSNDFNLIQDFLSMSEKSGYGYKEGNWMKMIQRKIDFTLNHILKKQEDQWICFSDIDVIFLKPIGKQIKELTKNEEVVGYFMSENAKDNLLNSGFYFLKCTEQNKQMFKDVQNELTNVKEKLDQPIIQKYLDERNINYKLLNHIEYSTNNYGHRYVEDNILKIKVFHSTGTASVTQKKERLDYVLRLSTESESNRP